MVSKLVKALAFQPNLVEEWGAETLSCSVAAKRSHYVARALQIYRALRPGITSQSLGYLLGRLHRFVAARPNGQTMLFIEFVATFKVIIETTKLSTFDKLPQLFWLPISLLNSDNIVEYTLALELVITLHKRFKWTDSKMAKRLTSTIPRNWYLLF